MKRHKMLEKGDRFGRLILTGDFLKKPSGSGSVLMVAAICDCGKFGWYRIDSIRRGKTKSCGCYQSDSLKENPHARKHGYYNHALYDVYRGMKERCYNQNSNRYHRYGGMGKIICDEWLKNPESFFKWAIANGWRRGFTIERKNNDGNYEPDNCKFILDGQARNRSTNVLLTAFGETKCIAEWVEDSRCQVTYSGLINRIGRDKAAWPDVEKAITTPPGTRGETVKYKSENRMLFAFGEEKSLSNWLLDERCVVNEIVFRNRLRVLNTRWKTIESILTTKVRKSR